MFQSFYMGGFECATHRRRDRRQIDVIHVTQHDTHAAEDYRLLAQAGIRTVRDGLRWHLIEKAPGVYDWSTFLPLLEASIATGTQVIWDLCHWGVPADIDVFSDEFPLRFAAFAAAAAEVVKSKTDAVPFYCPINEMSFWAWVGGDVETFFPHRTGSGPALKWHLVKASLAGIAAVRAVEPRARFVQAEPIINIVPDLTINDPDAIRDSARHTASQFEAWDMLRGDRDPKLGGSPESLDILGVNYYWNNQWIHGGDRAPLGHPQHRPLHVMLEELAERYGRPILITETGAESGAAAGWLGYVSAEVRQARRNGVDVQGICLYPVMDYPGWDDDRHCPVGVIAVEPGWNQRSLREDLASELRLQAGMMTSSS